MCQKDATKGDDMAGLDLSKLSRAEQAIVAAGAVAIVALFLPWYGASAGGFSASVSGFGTSYGWLGGLLIVAVGAFVLATRSGVKLPTLPIGPAVLVLAASALGLVIVAVRWATLPSGSGGVAGIATYSYGPSVGIILTLLLGAVQVVAAYVLFRASGESLPWRAAQGGSSGAGLRPGAGPGQTAVSEQPTATPASAAPAAEATPTGAGSTPAAEGDDPTSAAV